MIKILLIDDEDSVGADFTEFASQLENMSLTHCTTVAEAERQLALAYATEQFHIVIVDYDLRTSSTGSDFIGVLRDRGISIPTVLLTHHDDQAIAFQAGAAGATVFCNKEELISSEEFRQLVTRAMTAGLEQREAALRTAEVRTEGLSRLFDEFIHDTRDVFVPIIQSSQAVKETVDSIRVRGEILFAQNEIREDLDQTLIELQLIEERARDGLDNVEQLAEFARLGMIQLHVDDVDVAKLVDACIKLHLKPERRVVTKIDVPGRVAADDAILRRILASLLDNVEDHVPPESPVEITVNQRSADGVPLIRLSVRDYGLGVPSESRLRIFEPGVVGKRASRVAGRNKGLGLSIVRRLAELHHVPPIRGKAYCADLPDSGAMFVIELPMESI